MQKESTNNKFWSQWTVVVWLIRISCFFVFAGRGWQHLYNGDAPFRTLLWDQDLLTPLVQSVLGMSWEEYATSEKVDSTIQTSIHITGVFYLVCAVFSIFVERSRKFMKAILLLGSVSLTMLALLYFKDKGYQWAQFLEYASQFMAPAMLVWAVSSKTNTAPRFFEHAIRIAVALTFVCHGLYAFGYYPVPGNFVDMVIVILGVKDEVALEILTVAAVLDFAIGGIMLIGVFRPFAYGYAVFWGTATTLARPIANISFATFAGDFVQWAPEFLHRVPHALIPAAGLALTWPWFASKLARAVRWRDPELLHKVNN